MSSRPVSAEHQHHFQILEENNNNIEAGVDAAIVGALLCDDMTATAVTIGFDCIGTNYNHNPNPPTTTLFYNSLSQPNQY